MGLFLILGGCCCRPLNCPPAPCLACPSPDSQPANVPIGVGRAQFFPVPTRPVFSRRSDLPDGIEIQAVPLQPSIELIPTPQPEGALPQLSSKQDTHLR